MQKDDILQKENPTEARFLSPLLGQGLEVAGHLHDVEIIGFVGEEVVRGGAGIVGGEDAVFPRSEDCWSGMEASGTIYNLDTRTETDQHLLRLARYEESHWYWFYDEHWTFEERYSSEGRTAYMFFKY